MKHASHRMRAGAALITLAVGLAACGHSPPTRFFTLDPVAPASPPVATSPYRGPSLRVEAVHIPPVMNRPELIQETSANALRIDDFAQWAAPLGETARRTLTQDLAARLPAGSVVFPDSPKPAGGVGLVVDLLAFSQTADAAVLDVSWTVIAARAGGAVGESVGPAHVLRLTTPRRGSGAQAQAASLSDLLAQLADRIVADPAL